MDTIDFYTETIQNCKNIFLNKTNDYGSTWRHMRTLSLVDEMLIKVKRIKTIEELQIQKVEDSIEEEYMGIINYSIMAQINFRNHQSLTTDLTTQEADELFTTFIKDNQTLMEKKNHDYGEAWRDMEVTSMTDIILCKIIRIKKMIKNNAVDGTKNSEGPFSNFQDIVNYCIFALLKRNNK